jgi:hypothetical protein
MSMTDPRKKAGKSKYIAGAYNVSNILRSEDYIDQTFELFIRWLDKYAEDVRPMDINRYISFATFDVIGEVIFLTSFGFLQQGRDIGNAISNSLALNAYVALAGYFRWINIALLANPLMTWLSILPTGHLFNTTKAVLQERQENINVPSSIGSKSMRSVPRNSPSATLARRLLQQSAQGRIQSPPASSLSFTM